MPNKVAAVRTTGVVKFFDSRKGFGFIKPDGNTGQKDVFISINRLPKGVTTLPKDQRCSFFLAENKKGFYAQDLQLL